MPSARVEAFRLLGDDWRIEVPDAQGLKLFELLLLVTDAPAIRAIKPPASAAGS